MPDKKTDDDIAARIIREQKEQELEAKAKDMQEAQRERMEEAKERIRARSKRGAKKTYVIQAGDTLGKIAAKFYQDAGRWTDIYEANKAEIADPDAIKAGQEIVIP